ncbi:MAG: primosomal protein N', partial [Clostridia bacterium]
PVIEIVDKKQDSLSNTGNISNRLINEIKVNILNNEQTIIFLNKRGYSSYLTCIDCKSVYKCKKCDVAMTLHKSSNLLICHYCGNVEKNINKCNVCGSNNIKDSCYGTEKIEEELISKIPNISILRMDRDTTFKNNSHNEI